MYPYHVCNHARRSIFHRYFETPVSRHPVLHHRCPRIHGLLSLGWGLGSAPGIDVFSKNLKIKLGFVPPRSHVSQFFSVPIPKMRVKGREKAILVHHRFDVRAWDRDIGCATIGAPPEVHQHHIPGVKEISLDGANAPSASRRVGETEIIQGRRDMKFTPRASVVIRVQRKGT